MLRKFLFVFFIVFFLSSSVFSNRIDREFLLEELDDSILLYIETTEEAEDMYIKIDQIDYIGTKDYKDKIYFQFSIPREVYSKYGTEEEFIENLYINESGKEINILRTARENISKEKDSLNSINNQIITDGVENIEKTIPNDEVKKAQEDEELKKYYEDNERIKFKANPFFILGLILTIIGIIINLKKK
ncbi:MAG: hypothetical protein Q4P31_06850 [Andreesenia angusta]|nr:hypothetical protein [Andreesenia angusta]